MQFRNATLVHTLLTTFVAFLFSVWNHAATIAAPLEQPSTALPIVLLVPTDSSSISLQTHIAQLTVFENGGGAMGAQVSANFRLRNSLLTPATTFVRVTSALSGTLPADLTIAIGGQAVGLQTLDTGALVFPVELAGEGRVDIDLTYSLVVPATPYHLLEYSVTSLVAWQTRISLNIRMILPSSVTAESVIDTLPDYWSFPATGSGSFDIRWLYDGFVPEQPFLVSFVEPTYWQQIVTARQAAANGSIGDFVRLGDLYEDLSVATTDNVVSAGFYAQALAAFTTGLERNPDPATATELQIRLAHLYRSQIVTTNSNPNPDYARLASQAADAALTALAADDPRRVELTQWRVDALSVLLNAARRRSDWTSARQILDQLNALSPQSGTSRFVVDARKRLVIQQALQLLEEGNRTAAIAIAGSEIDAADLRAPDDLQSLFESWQVTVTLSAAGSQLDWIGLPAADRSEAALIALQELVNSWKTRSNVQNVTVLLQPTTAAVAAQPYLLSLNLPPGVTGVSLAEATPGRTDWALFRSLFLQLAPKVEQIPQLFHQQVTIRQSLDLHTIAEQWRAMTDNLEKRAATYEALAAAPTSGDDASAETALRARIQLANYRGAARIWSSLTRNSSVVVVLTTANNQARSWLFTPTAPAQSLEFSALTLNWGRVLATMAGALVLLFLVAGGLWSML